ncbi:MAG: hypothetical protein HQK65_14535 [Desulfamplus sp.]|nr:hypothetical protein [Desulfamplus sp.]
MNKIISISLFVLLSLAQIITPFVFADDLLSDYCRLRNKTCFTSSDCIKEKIIIQCKILGWQGLFEGYVDKTKLGQDCVKNSYPKGKIYDALVNFEKNKSLDFIKELEDKEKLELLIKAAIKCNKSWISNSSDWNELSILLNTYVIGCPPDNPYPLSDCK